MQRCSPSNGHSRNSLVLCGLGVVPESVENLSNSVFRVESRTRRWSLDLPPLQNWELTGGVSRARTFLHPSMVEQTVNSWQGFAWQALDLFDGGSAAKRGLYANAPGRRRKFHHAFNRGLLARDSKNNLVALIRCRVAATDVLPMLTWHPF